MQVPVVPWMISNIIFDDVPYALFRGANSIQSCRDV